MFFQLVPNTINYIFSPDLYLSNGKQLFLQQETRPHVNGFPLGCCDHSTLCSCDHSNLMEREPYYPAVGVLIATQISHTVLFLLRISIVFGVS
jgi:hypothetical protein